MGEADPGRGRGYHGMLEGRGESRGFTFVCWRTGGIQRAYHGMVEGRVDPER